MLSLLISFFFFFGHLTNPSKCKRKIHPTTTIKHATRCIIHIAHAFPAHARVEMLLLSNGRPLLLSAIDVSFSSLSCRSSEPSFLTWLSKAATLLSVSLSAVGSLSFSTALSLSSCRCRSACVRVTSGRLRSSAARRPSARAAASTRRVFSCRSSAASLSLSCYDGFAH